ncbi:hypothetical protein HMPREF1624_07473 [Sporothrix schenckii ATCC 58251]|uniref:Cyclin N-terminal domain-containing protein n=1 Tax=Sporothrix schenckii (strain ATCC 58251 / de Perez 2211183) TaxID=1391915 RepID=U7PJY7_SPOS1|nr:hypothetical protein HMPREF1624_07473 [Sporothrix schenckii ATCC 58251]
MDFADAAVLAGHGYPGPAPVTTGDNAAVDPTAPRTTASKLADTPAIDDEDLFLGDEGDHDNDNDDNDNHVEADDEEDEDEDDDDGDDDFDEDYFSSTYRPLSNLPTPPPSSHTSSLAQSPYAGAHAYGHAHGYAHGYAHGHAHGPSTAPDASDSPLLGPAVHLVNLLPPAASLATPSVALVQAMLARAALPLDTVALAVCILDSLDSRFARAWRLTCPLTPPAAPPTAPPTALSSSTRSPPPSLAVLEKRHTLPSPLTPTFPTSTPTPASPTSPALLTSDGVRGGLHIDAVFPEVIVLAALVIAAKFTDDGFVSQQPAQAYCTAWGATPPPRPSSMSSSLSPSSSPSPGGASSSSPPGPCLWTGAQLAATERCIMQNLGYRILPLLDADLLADAKADMRRAGAHAVRARRASAVPLSSAAGSPSSAKRGPPTKKMEMALMTPPAEAGAEAGVDAKHGAANETANETDRDESRDAVVDTSKVISLNFPSNMRRHVSSRSETLGRYSGYEH